MDRGDRSRTNSTSSLRSPAQPATPSVTPSHTPVAGQQLGPSGARLLHPSPDQLAAGLSRLRGASGGSRSSSIPATPAPTPNPLLQVTQHVVGPEQLAAGINSLRADEGYVESSSFPATPAPSPFSPSPGSLQGTISSNFNPDQVAEGIQRLCDEGGVAPVSGSSSAQPPTPSTTPGPVPGAVGGVGAVGVQQHQQQQQQQQQQQLGVIPEHLAQGIAHLHRAKDEGLESGSNPATPIPTPISPSPAANRVQVLPEQLAAGIHRLKVEEGMSSGGSSDFPSTPAPTPFHPNPGGVRPEELAAGISRLSVIEESDSSAPHSSANMEAKKEAKEGVEQAEKSASSSSQPDLSQYFGGGQAADSSHDDSTTSSQQQQQQQQQQSFFDQINVSLDPSVLHSCRESRVDLSTMEESSKTTDQVKEAKIEVVEQSYDDARSLRKRQSSERSQSLGESKEGVALPEEPSVCTIFSKEDAEESPFDSVSGGGGGGEGAGEEEGGEEGSGEGERTDKKQPSPGMRLEIENTALKEEEGGTEKGSTAASSNYSTPVAPTPNMDGQGLGYSTYVTSTAVMGTLESGAAQLLSPVLSQDQPSLAANPVLPPPLPPPPSSLQSQLSVSSAAEEPLVLPDEVLSEPEDPELQRRSQAWPPNQATAQILQSIAASTPGTFYPDRATLTMPGVVLREELADPVRSLVAHYRGEQEAVKRQVLTASAVTQDQRGLRQLVRAGCYRAAVNLTGRLLQMYNQGAGQGGSLSKHTPSSLQIWFARLALLVKLRQFSVAEVEAEAFGDLDRPDLYFQFYQEMYPKRTGSMVPFGFRLLLAELPQYLGKQHETLDRLYSLLGKVRQVLLNLDSGRNEEGQISSLSDEDKIKSQTLWKERETRVLYSLSNSAIMQKDFQLAVETLSTLLRVESETRKSKILSAMGRLYLQLGDIESAQRRFSHAYKLRGETEDDRRDSLMDMAFLSIANNDYQSALATLQKAAEIFPSDPVIVNNAAVCHLYLGRLQEGLSYLEQRMTAEPALLLQETLVLNLATIYELESSYAGQKKRALLDLVSQYRGDSINTACLKLQ